MGEIVLAGLDGRNPLAFLAALGVLNCAADAIRPGHPEPALCWRQAGAYRPVLVGGPDREALLDLLVRDAASFENEPALQLCYSKADDKKPGRNREVHDLKAPPEVYLRYLRSLLDGGSERGLAFAAAFATDTARDHGGNTKPTALHLTSGTQQFLAMVQELRKGVSREDFKEAVFGPWRYARELPVLQWDSSQARDYALHGADPSKDKKHGVPGADWLALRGLPFVRVAPVGHRIVTTGCRGGWKSGFFRWPMWTPPLVRAVVASLMTSPELFEMNQRSLLARGIPAVFESAIRRADQGGRGSFSPAHIAQHARLDAGSDA